MCPGSQSVSFRFLRGDCFSRCAAKLGQSQYRLVDEGTIMIQRRAVLCLSALLLLVASAHAFPQTAQQDSAPTPTLRVTSSLVFLDVTVLDKKGHPVVTGLTKDDFTITEEKKPERIFSFEAPDEHTVNAESSDENPNGKAPVTILVLDLLNSRFEDFAFIRYSARRFLLAQPEQLASPAELLVIGNESLDMLQGYTRSRADLLYALNHLPAALPYKHMNGAFFGERFGQSIDALQEIALQNKGVPGRKNIIWVGHGGPSVQLNLAKISPETAEKIREYVHLTTNMLVEARISMFVIYPGLAISQPGFSLSAQQAAMVIGDDDPFSGDINFGLLSNETGGLLFYNRNDVDAEIRRSEQLGANYYTLTYQPETADPDGKFRRVRVTTRNPLLHVITKAGYYAPDAKAVINEQQQKMIKLADAVQSAILFDALSVNLTNVVRHPDSRTVEFTVLMNSRNLDFLATEDGQESDLLIVAAASLNRGRYILASRVERTMLKTASQNLTKHPVVASHFQIAVPYPKRTRTVRVVVEDQNGGRIGTAELDRSAIDAAPESPTPEPQLLPHAAGDKSPNKPRS
jgi:VWFA-related protein